MKKIITIILCLSFSVVKIQVIDANDLNLYAKSYALIDGNSGRLLIGENVNNKMAMASTTKIMTCMIALENADLDKICTVSSNASAQPRVRMNIRKGEEYRLGDLLYALMLESYNDVAVAVAENVAGSVEKFAVLMNKKAKEIGARNTNFVTPNGLDAQNHYSTAYDMALIGAYAIKSKKFITITNASSHNFSDKSGKRNITVHNKDAFLSMDSDAIGIKTGFTGKAGYCFVGAVETDGRKFVSCVLASGWPPNRSYKWSDTQKLMNLGKEKYNIKTIFAADRHISVKIDNGTKEYIDATVINKSEMLLSKEDHIDIKTNIKTDLPIKKKMIIGNVEVFVNNELIERHDVVSNESVYKYDFLYCLKKTFDCFVFQ